MRTESDVKIIQKNTVYQGFFRLDHYLVQHRLFEGGFSGTLEREVFERGSAAAALLYDPLLDQVVLIEQFRIGALTDPDTPWLLELVAGILDKNEKPEELVAREAEEEAGLQIHNLHFMYHYWVSPGASTEQLTLFCAQVDASKASGIHGLPEEGEDIRVLPMPVEKAYQLLEAGKIKNAPTMIGLLWLKLNQQVLKKKWKPLT